LQIAFAARVATSALPFLNESNEGFLRFWQTKDRAEHLFSVLHSLNVAYLVGNDFNSRIGFASTAKKREFNLETAIFKELNSLKTDESILAYLFSPLLMPEIRPRSLGRLLSRNMENPALMYENPALIHQGFIAVLRRFSHGFDWWADWYQDRLDGKAIDLALLEKTALLDRSLINQGSAAVNAYLKSLTMGEGTQYCR
jgi:hypothetical protein